jgi:DNA-binding NarL/FixJ family response regulator
VNPKHLFLADHATNMQDSKSKGRTRGPNNLHGEANPAARLSATDVREIRRLYRRGLTIALIARRFLTAESNVSSIVKRQTWKEVS